MTMRIFISDKMSPEGLANFTGHEGFEAVYDPEITMEALADKLRDCDALVIRSRTKVTRAMLASPGKLKIIGRAGAGVDNVDVEAATEKGIVVMNTPGGNTLSTAEHAISMLLALARRIPFADRTMKDGKWEKKGIIGVEMFGKTLGVIGLGKIGRVVAERMLAFGMKILAHDPFVTHEVAKDLGVELADLDTICRQADVITVHAPANAETKGMIGAARLALMKPTALLVNCARGGIVDEAALVEALAQKKIAGAALDVFSEEPLPADHPLRKLDNVVLTPHLAASTNEAQEKVAGDIAEQIFEALGGGVIRNAVNAPSVDAKTYARIKEALDLCERMGSFVSQVMPAPLTHLDVTFSGTKARHPSTPLVTALLKGYLKNVCSEPVNDVSVPYRARQLGIKVSETKTDESDAMYAGVITVRMTAEGELVSQQPARQQGLAGAEKGKIAEIGATLDQLRRPRLVSINGRRIDAAPEGQLLVLENEDVPGVIGAVCTALGKRQINIASMDWSRGAGPGSTAMTVINVDQKIGPDVVREIESLPHVMWARSVVI
jgi:D-3-phosphoglycerate dehydrogenase